MRRRRAKAARAVLLAVTCLLACAPKPSVLETVSEQLPARPPTGSGAAAGSAEGAGTDAGSSASAAAGEREGGSAAAGGGAGEQASVAAFEGRFVRFTGEELIFIGVVTFEGEATLSEAGREAIDEVGELMRTRPGIARLEIQAHVDAKGEGDQVAITQRRADAVRDHLVAQGVDARRLEARGYGSQMPIDSNRTLEGRAANRRVDFVLLELAK